MVTINKEIFYFICYLTCLICEFVIAVYSFVCFAASPPALSCREGAGELRRVSAFRLSVSTVVLLVLSPQATSIIMARNAKDIFFCIFLFLCLCSQFFQLVLALESKYPCEESGYDK